MELHQAPEGDGWAAAMGIPQMGVGYLVANSNNPDAFYHMVLVFLLTSEAVGLISGRKEQVINFLTLFIKHRLNVYEVLESKSNVVWDDEDGGWLITRPWDEDDVDEEEDVYAPTTFSSTLVGLISGRTEQVIFSLT
jgi:hypothetical protein